MPVQVSYPGVYIEEIPSGVRTITGVATSITAFIGRARRGPVHEPVTLNHFGDYEKVFGGLHQDYMLSYAVRDFFLNGGSTAVVVRLISSAAAVELAYSKAKEVADAAASAPDVAAAKSAVAAKGAEFANDASLSAQAKAAVKKVVDAVAAVASTASLPDVQKAANDSLPPAPAEDQPPAPSKATLSLPGANGSLILEAANEGVWGNDLQAWVDVEDITDAVAARFGAKKAEMFNLSVRLGEAGPSERFAGVLAVPNHPRGVDSVLKSASNLVRVQDPPKLPTANTGKKSELEKWTKVQTQGADGGGLTANDFTADGFQADHKGLYALDKTELFNLLCIPPDVRGGTTDSTVYQQALAYCEKRRAMLLVDSPAVWSANPDGAASTAREKLLEDELKLAGQNARNAALFFPRVRQADPKRDGLVDTFVPCGIIAGVMARTDSTRGVWKAPAGLDASLNGIQALEVNLTDAENGMLNPLGINCLRFFRGAGRVVWGARTLRGADQLADEWKYIPVRRLALYIEESLYRGTQWVVFEPNDEPLWAQIRLNVGAFMHNLFRQGAFQGASPREAYFVKCDKETTPQNDINLGIVNIVVGFAPLKPAEFVIIKLQQMAGQIEV